MGGGRGLGGVFGSGEKKEGVRTEGFDEGQKREKHKKRKGSKAKKSWGGVKIL